MTISQLRPHRFNERQLAKVGVRIVSLHNLILACESCRQAWSPMLRRGGKMPAGYWKCPNGCNNDQQ